jgi:hypothetical protein
MSTVSAPATLLTWLNCYYMQVAYLFLLYDVKGVWAH